MNTDNIKNRKQGKGDIKLDKTTLEKKRQHEQAILSDMIDIYCSGHGHKQPCKDCLELKAYALKRTKLCPHMATKSYCSVCDTHCYAPDQQEAIRQVMRYSGRKYFLRHPIQTIAHGWATLQARRQQIALAEDK